MFGAYIHIPFCRKICSYCDFCKVLYQEKYLSSYLDSLEKEIKSRYQFELLDSIYVGGGTPSSLPESYLERLLQILKIFKLKNNYEYTIEFNIEDITLNKILILKKYGINRISVGIETFNESLKSNLNRNINLKQATDNIYLLKQYFSNINIDLIYGITSDIKDVSYDLKKYLELDVPHISYYSLIIEPNTKYYIDSKEYIDEDTEYAMYKLIEKTLEENHYKHYEISNYAKEGYESIHNKNYWLNGPYYGFGLGAVSYLNNNRISNTRNLNKYLNNEYIKEINYEDIAKQKENDLILGLRLVEGISISKFNNKYHDDLLNIKIIKELIHDNYLKVKDDKLLCNKEFIYVENSILSKLIGEEL